MALDVIFLVDGSVRSLDNFAKHQQRFPHIRKLKTALTGVDAFKAAGKSSNTSSFFLVDHGYLVDDGFDFTFTPEEFDKGYVHSWKFKDLKTNPRVSVMPDHGGVYFFTKAQCRSKENTLDKFGDGVKYLPTVASRPLPLDIIVVAYDGNAYNQNAATATRLGGQSKIAIGATKKDAYLAASQLAETENYFVVDCNYKIINFYFDFKPHDYDASYAHVWHCLDDENKIRPGAVAMFNKNSLDYLNSDLTFSFGENVKFHNELISKFNPEPPSIIFLSYDEPNAEINWSRLVSRFPHAKRIHGVKGILNAHKAAAKAASTNNFFVVDGDTQVLDSFKFELKNTEYDKLHYVHIWLSQNPANSLKYGYGGIKLFHKDMFSTFDETIVDMTTLLGDGVKLIDEVASITHFDSDEFRAYRGAFREGCKLASGIIKNSDNEESMERLNTWCTIAYSPYSQFIIRGANAGRIYGEANANDINALQRINDFEWIKQSYRKTKMKIKEQELLRSKYSKIDISLITDIAGLMYEQPPLISLEAMRDALSVSEMIGRYWLIDELNNLCLDESLTILMINEGIGILSNLLFQSYKESKKIIKILSCDEYQHFVEAADKINLTELKKHWRFKAACESPYEINYENTVGSIFDGSNRVLIELDWNAIINPACERFWNVAEWAFKIPPNKLVVVQKVLMDYEGLDSEIEFEKFKNQLNLTTIIYEGLLPCDVYDRFMIIGYK